MKTRDLALVLAVLVVVGAALADAVRDGGGTPPTSEPETAPTGTRADARSYEFEPLPSGRTPPVPAAGTLVFTDARDCRLREADVGGARERELPVIRTSCRLWAPPTGRRVAFGAPESTDALAALEFVNLDRPEEIADGSGFVGPVVWSRDGSRAAWCDSATSGYELAFGNGDARRLDICPRGYVRAELAHQRGRELVVGDDVVGAARQIEQVTSGVNGELAVVVEGGSIERIDRRGAARGIRLPSAGVASELVFAPDLCAAAAVGAASVTVVDLGCFRGRGQVVTVSTDNCINRREGPNAKCARYPAPRTFEGSAAAWSPDGRWLVVAEPTAISFHRLVGGYRVVRWPAQAADLAWVG